jgi:hypothetical protein
MPCSKDNLPFSLRPPSFASATIRRGHSQCTPPRYPASICHEPLTINHDLDAVDGFKRSASIVCLFARAPLLLLLLWEVAPPYHTAAVRPRYLTFHLFVRFRLPANLQSALHRLSILVLVLIRSQSSQQSQKKQASKNIMCLKRESHVSPLFLRFALLGPPSMLSWIPR